MAVFPKLKTEAVAQYPTTRRISASIRVFTFVDGSEQRYPQHPSPLRTWLLKLNALGADEVHAIEDFFLAMQGSAADFTFVDPWDNTEYQNCSFGSDSSSILYRDDFDSSMSIVIHQNRE